MSVLAEIRRSTLYHRPIPKVAWDALRRYHDGMVQRFTYPTYYAHKERTNMITIYFDVLERLRRKFYPESTGGEQWDRRRT